MLQRKISETGVTYYTSPILNRAGIPHAFSTRIGGVSNGAFASLNLGNPTGQLQDDKQRIQENYRRFEQAIGAIAAQRCWVHQVHGADVVILRNGQQFTCGANADALIGNDATRTLSIRTADCVPILLGTMDGCGVAAVHAGWRGVIAGVVPAAIRELCRVQSITPDKILAAVGPCIGFDAFEVGADVLREFDRVFASAAPTRSNGNGKGYVDLRAAVRAQLQKAAIAEANIDMTDRCTYRDAEEFFSHRRERGVTGRMAALIAPRST